MTVQLQLKHLYGSFFYVKSMNNFRENRDYDDTEFATIEPKILYFGTPVALITSMNRDGSPNLAPISSFWALGWTITLGLNTETQTLKNFRMCPDCVINLPSPDMWEQVERIAPLTGQNPVPEKKASHFRFEPDKFRVAGFSMILARRSPLLECWSVRCSWKPVFEGSTIYREMLDCRIWAEVRQ